MFCLRASSVLCVVALFHGIPAGERRAADDRSLALSEFYSATGEWIPFSRCDPVVGACIPSSIRTCMQTAEGCVDRMPWEPPQAR